MDLRADHHFVIGNDHIIGGKPCQDYGISGGFGDAVYGIVSDGCSDGGNTDVGARLLAISTAAALREYHDIYQNSWQGKEVPEIATYRMITLNKVIHSLGIETRDILATCAYIISGREGGYVHIQGDGAVSLKYRFGKNLLMRFSWDNEMPFYPIYQPRSVEQFIKSHGNNPEKEAFTVEQWRQAKGGKCIEAEKRRITVREGMKGVFIPFNPKEIECVAVFSDGVAQIEGMDWKEAILELVAFKTTAGEFAKRRMIRFVRDSKKIGKGPLDDIAYAVVLAEEEDGQNGN